MKRNALMRIILWSVILCGLVFCLFSLLFGVMLNRRQSVTAVTAVTEVPEESTSYHQEAFTSNASFDPGQISDLEIDWVAGSITLQTADVAQIRISETEVSSPKQQMVWKVKNGKLSIDYCEESIQFPSFGMDVPSKALTILVPEGWYCDSLEIDTAAASVTVVGLSIREAELDSASEECLFENCQVDQLDIDTASGDIYFTGSLNTLDCDAASANVEAVLINVPKRIDLDTMSGNLELTLPEDAGFALQLDSASEKFSTDFQNVTMRNGEYIFGDGSCRIYVSAMSGKVGIWKAGEAYRKQRLEQTPYGGEN